MLTSLILAAALSTQEQRDTCSQMAAFAEQVAQMRDAGAPLSDSYTLIEDRARDAYVQPLKSVARIVYKTDMTPRATRKVIEEGCLSGLS